MVNVKHKGCFERIKHMICVVVLTGQPQKCLMQLDRSRRSHLSESKLSIAQLTVRIKAISVIQVQDFEKVCVNLVEIAYIYIYIYIAKTDKRHIKKRVDCSALFSTYSTIWTLNTLSKKPVLSTFKASRVYILLQKPTSTLVVFEQKPISPF